MLSIPDKGEAQNDIQSILFQEYLDVLVAGIEGIDCVLSGGAVTAQGTPDMTVAVAKAAVLTNGVLRAVAAGNATITTADSSNPRLDLVVVNSSGSIAVRAGTPAAAPKPPARSANDVVLACVFVPASDTTISAAQIVDLRVARRGPIVIYRTTSAETTNTTNAAIHALNKSGSGVVIPNGLLLSGRQLRVRLGGNMLCNSGTTTITAEIEYGGTTLWKAGLGTTANDTDRLAWDLNFVINAQANNDQALVGSWISSRIGAKTAPTNGIGDPSDTNNLAGAISGAAAIDSDAADRTLAVKITFSVSNASVELVVENATVEIL